MEDQQSNTSQPKYTGIEMITFRDPEQPATQFGPFPGSARRLNTDNQRSDRESDGHQVVGNISPIQQDAMPDIVITDGMNLSPGASTSGQSIAQEWPQLVHGDILNPEDAGGDSYFLEMHELQSLTIGECSTEQLIDIYGLDTKIVIRGSASDDETTDTDDESYFLAESELQSHSLSNPVKRLHPNETEPPQEFVYSSIRKSKRGTKQKHRVREVSKEVADDYWRRSYLRNDDNTSELSFLEQGVSEPKRPRRHLTKPEPTQALVYSSIRKSKTSAKQHRKTPAKPTEVDGEYWRRTYQDNDDTTLEQSSVEQGVPEPQRQWYRSRNTRPQAFCSPRRNLGNFECILLYASVVMFFACVLFWIYVWYTVFNNISVF